MVADKTICNIPFKYRITTVFAYTPALNKVFSVSKQSVQRLETKCFKQLCLIVQQAGKRIRIGTAQT